MSKLRIRILKRYLLLWVLALIVLAVFAAYSYSAVQDYQRFQLNSVEAIQSLPEGFNTVVVFGAAITPDGQPRSVLRERLDTARQLLDLDEIQTVIVSGYNDTVNNDYNEPQAMRNYLLSRGVAPQAIRVDEHGDSTAETCQRAYTDLGINQAVLVTQPSHMNRALYTCHHIGMEAYGHTAGVVDSSWNYWHQRIREIFGNIKAVVESEIL